MKSFFNDEDGFSIKDLYGLIFCFLFTGIVIYALAVGSPEQKATSINLLQIISPIVLTLLGGYAVTEGAKGIINTYNNKSTIRPQSPTELVPFTQVQPLEQSQYTTTTVTPQTPLRDDSDGSI
jgi:hypothetical protein